MENLENINLEKYKDEFLCLDKMNFNNKNYLYLMGYATPKLLVVEQTDNGLIQLNEEKSKELIKVFTKRLISKQDD
mgnify:CR=1 FL=1